MKKSLFSYFGIVVFAALLLANCSNPAASTGHSDSSVPSAPPGPSVPPTPGGQPAAGDSLKTLSGSITISPAGNVITGAELSAAYSGSETVTYQWNHYGVSVSGGTGYKHKTVKAGHYTVTVSAAGYNSKTSGSVTVEDPPTPGLAFKLINNDTAYSVSKGTVNHAEIVIPSIHEGKPVTVVEDNGFSSYTIMTSISIPDSVTSIGQNAFSGCSGLTSITIPFVGATLNGTSNTHFGYIFGASNYNGQNSSIPASLKTVIISGGNSIAANAFSGCSNLANVTISGVTSIGSGTFSGCNGLTSITIPFVGETLNGTSNTHFGYIFGASSYNGQNSSIPASLKNIIVTGGDSIASNAFYGSSGLTSVTIGNRVTSIGGSAFQKCTGLTSITIPFVGAALNGSEKTFFGYIFGAPTYNNQSSYTPASLKTVIITGGNSIGQYAFYYCSGLTSITIPNSVTSIGLLAFHNCSSLTSITIPTSVTSIGGGAFSYCSGLSSVTIPNSVTSIGGSAFSNCTGLTSVTIPNSVTSIGGSAFSNCTGLTSINFNATAMDNLKRDDNVFSSAGKSANGITVNIGANVTKIPVYLFCVYNSPTNIPKITTVNFAEGSLCQSIGGGAFYYCSSLTSIKIPNSVTSIGGSAFNYCSGLSSITIPNSVTSIGNYAFQFCSSLTSITIPNNVTSIGVQAFDMCSGLSSISVVSGNTVYRSEGNCLIQISDNTLLLGCKSSIIPNNVTSIASYAFRGSGLTSITIPNNVTSIGDTAFADCSGLTSVTIPNSVTSINVDLFRNSGLKSVTIPNSVTSIGKQAFVGCNDLTSVTFQGTIPSSDFSTEYVFTYKAGPAGTSVVSDSDLRSKFYASDSINGTPGTYTRPSGSDSTWKKI